MDYCLVQRLVGIQQLHVLAYHGKIHFLDWIQVRIDDAIPFGEVSGRAVQPKFIDNDIVEIRHTQNRRDSVDRVRVWQRNYGLWLNVGKQRNFLPCRFVDFHIGATDQDIRLDTDRA